jgi:hypothetical protein
MATRVRSCTPRVGDDEDADGPEAAGAVRVGRLDSLDRVRREAVRLYKDCRLGRLAPGDASKLAHVLDLVRRLVEAGDLERRLEELEEAVRRGLSPDDPALGIARQLRAARAGQA